MFYGLFQGMYGSYLKEQIKQGLTAVRLISEKNNSAGSYSGGMKRRLSVAISALGNKKIIFLDEMTTGMDPQNRKHVWDMVKELKKGRIVIMTTHSMEEAEALGDNIGIMSEGKLIALGNLLHLKSKFGGGYKIKIVCGEGKKQDIMAAVFKYTPKAVLVDDSAGNLSYDLGTDSQDQIPALFNFIENAPAELLTDWAISGTTLEDVFISLTKMSHGQVTHVAQAVPTAKEAKVDAPDVFDTSAKERVRTETDMSNFKQFRGLFFKMVAMQKRQVKTNCCQLFTPAVLLGILRKDL